MKINRTVGRNELCPCGSGRKFKACCQGKIAEAPAARSYVGWVAAIGGGLLVALAIGKAVSDSKARQRETNVPQTAEGSVPFTQPSAGGTRQPPGPAPAGKVWSSEHGHWHDAPSSARTGLPTPAVANSVPTPQPPGEAPPGKVWSAEHGHWHDANGSEAPAIAAPSGSSVVSNAKAPPPGPAPAGKVWSAEHGHWHDAPAATVAPGGALSTTPPAAEPAPGAAASDKAVPLPSEIDLK